MLTRRVEAVHRALEVRDKDSYFKAIRSPSLVRLPQKSKLFSANRYLIVVEASGSFRGIMAGC